MEKGAEAFRSIGEVAKLVGVAPHVLRYWESQFSQLSPMKRRDGRRYYRPDDVRLVAGLCEILREEGLTIRGARKMLARDRGDSVRARGAARLADTTTSLPVAPTPKHASQPAAGRIKSAGRGDAERTPLSRKRNRPSAAGKPGQMLPLFPELTGRPGAAIDRNWLFHLVETTAALRARQAWSAPSRSLLRPAQSLHDAISALD